MAPIASADVEFYQRLTKPDLRDRTLALIEQATRQPELAAFKHAQLRCTEHTSSSDLKPHSTVRLSTEAQAARGAWQTVHIYADKYGGYAGHTLYPEDEDE